MGEVPPVSTSPTILHFSLAFLVSERILYYARQTEIEKKDIPLFSLLLPTDKPWDVVMYYFVRLIMSHHTRSSSGHITVDPCASSLVSILACIVDSVRSCKTEVGTVSALSARRHIIQIYNRYIILFRFRVSTLCAWLSIFIVLHYALMRII